MKPVPTDRRCGGPIAVRLRTGMRVLAGCFFLLTGLAKLPVMAEVAPVVRAILGTGDTESSAIAAIVTGAEMAIGALLISSIGVRHAAAAGIIGMGLFAAALGSLLLRGVDLDCHCFGVLGFRLPLAGELGIDLALIAVLLPLLKMLPGNGRPGEGLRATMIGLVSFALSGGIAIAGPSARSLDSGREILRRAAGGENIPLPRMILLLDYRELHCSLCFDDLLELADSLRGRGPAGWERTLTVIRSSGPEGMQEGDLRTWAAETGISGRIWIPGPEEYDALHAGPNMALLLLPDGLTHVRMELPLGRENRNRLLAELAF